MIKTLSIEFCIGCCQDFRPNGRFYVRKIGPKRPKFFGLIAISNIAVYIQNSNPECKYTIKLANQVINFKQSCPNKLRKRC